MPGKQHTPRLLLNIRSNYSELNPAMRQIADYLLAEGQAVTQSIHELALRAGVSDASVTRFVHLLGFNNFKGFQLDWAKSTVKEEAKAGREQSDNTIVFEYGGASPQDSASEIGRKVFQSNIQMLRDTMDTIDYKKVEQVTKRILQARNLVFFGVGHSFVTASNGRIRFYRLGINSFSYSDTQEQTVAATTCTEHDVFFGISNFGRSAAVVKNIALARRRKAFTVGITSAAGSPLTQAVDLCFLTACNNANIEYRTNDQAFEPACESIAQIALLDCIYMNVALRRDKSCFDMFYSTAKELAKERL